MKNARLLAAGLMLASPLVLAAYPDHPVRMIVPVAAGGNVDMVARAMAENLTRELGQTFIVENRPGASSLLGTQIVAKAPADGYTILATSTTFLSAPAVVKAPGYDPNADFAHISLTCSIPMVMEVNPSVPANNVKEFIALAKSQPGKISYASSGIGSTGHIATELFSQMAHVKLLHVPYKGNAQSLVDVVGGQVNMMFDQVSTSVQHIASGKLRPLGVSTKVRSKILPNVPTIDEAGVRGYQDATINAIFAPVATPKDIVQKLHEAVVKAVHEPATVKRFGDIGIVMVSSPSTKEFDAYVKRETARYVKLVKDAGITAE
ncbi:MAG TPA: tripartite tricarboxylate transporter substrate binding protein [Burkholderiales bacterium]|jgi:tripartite-type tricarboxylate transporter receptor subunit TctC